MLWYQSLSVGDFPSPCVPHPSPDCLQTYHLTGLRACLLLCHIFEQCHSFPWPFLFPIVASVKPSQPPCGDVGSSWWGRPREWQESIQVLPWSSEQPQSWVTCSLSLQPFRCWNSLGQTGMFAEHLLCASQRIMFNTAERM